MTIYLYWIHYPSHTDPSNEGYVGVTVNPTKRLKYHNHPNNSDNPILKAALRKGATMSILEECGTREDALSKELKLRPSRRLGWNIIPGGTTTPSKTGIANPNVSISNRSRAVSAHTKNLMSEARKGRKWFTDGVTDVRAFTCPEGFNHGRSKKWKWDKKLPFHNAT